MSLAVLGLSLPTTTPLSLLRIAPLLSSTGSLIHAVVELTTTSAFLGCSVPAAAAATALPSWFSSFYRGAGSVVLLNAISTWSAVANLYLGAPDASRCWYVAGLVTAVRHMAFVPVVMGPVKDIIDDKRGKEVREKGKEVGEGPRVDMARWVGVHKVRMLVADLPAWVCFLGAVLNCVAGV